MTIHLADALSSLKGAFEFLEACRRDKTSAETGAIRDAHDWLETAARGVLGATPPGPAIRFLVHTVSSAADSSGNRRQWARITSTVSGRSLVVLDTTESNARIMACHACELLGLNGCYPEVHDTSADRVPARHWKASVPKQGVYEHLVTPQMIADLENPE